MEVGESAESALGKELRQETGLGLVGKPRLLSVDFDSGVSDRDHVLFYLCETEAEGLPISPSLEISELDYFNPYELPLNTSPAVKRALDKFRNTMLDALDSS